MIIIRDTDKCYDCKVCQLICSYHHTRAFWPEKSSIKVSRNPQNGIINWSIDSSCDGCENEGEPLCVKFCIYGAIHAVKSKKNEEVKTHE